MKRKRKKTESHRVVTHKATAGVQLVSQKQLNYIAGGHSPRNPQSNQSKPNPPCKRKALRSNTLLLFFFGAMQRCRGIVTQRRYALSPPGHSKGAPVRFGATVEALVKPHLPSRWVLWVGCVGVCEGGTPLLYVL